MPARGFTRRCLLTAGIIGFLPSIGCNDPSDTDAGRDGGVGDGSAKVQGGLTSPVKVTATVGMVADVVREVGGPHVRVSQICGSGVDPHLKKTTRDDVRRMMESSDLIYYAGLMLEGKMSDTLVRMAASKPVIGGDRGVGRVDLAGTGRFCRAL